MTCATWSLHAAQVCGGVWGLLQAALPFETPHFSAYKGRLAFVIKTRLLPWLSIFYWEELSADVCIVRRCAGAWAFAGNALFNLSLLGLFMRFSRRTYSAKKKEE